MLPWRFPSKNMYLRGERVILSLRIRGILGNVFSRRREHCFYTLSAMRFRWNWQSPPPCYFDDFWGGIWALVKPVISRRREARFWCVTKKAGTEFFKIFVTCTGWGNEHEFVFLCVFTFLPHPILLTWRLFWGITAVFHILCIFLRHNCRTRPETRYKNHENENWKFTFRVGENACGKKQSK